MSFEISNVEQFDASFVAAARKLASLQARYDHHKDEAQRVRMELIGIAEEQKSKYPQRSPEARYIQQGYEANGWTDDIIKKNKAAWRAYNQFLSNVNVEVQELAKASSVGHLYEFSRPDSGSMWWDAMKYLKRHKKMPSVKQLRGHRAGFADSQFRFRGGSSGSIRDMSRPDLRDAASTPELPSRTLTIDAGNPPLTVFTPLTPLQPSPCSDVSSNTCYLFQSLQSIVDQLLDIRPQWAGDHRVAELIDAQRLSDLTNQLCAGRDLGFEF